MLHCPYCKGNSIQTIHYPKNLLTCKCYLCGKKWIIFDDVTTSIYPNEKSKWNTDDGDITPIKEEE